MLLRASQHSLPANKAVGTASFLRLHLPSCLLDALATLTDAANAACGDGPAGQTATALSAEPAAT